MGSQVCAAVEAAPDLELVARIDAGDDLGAVSGADVAVVFSVPDVAVDHVLACVRRGVHAVVGTTGWTTDRLDAVAARWPAPGVGVLVAPNFALGAVLLMRFAALAAPHYESVEIVELHHPDKVDAPSGTARHTARLVADARREAGVGARARRHGDRPSTAPAAPTWTASACTRCACAGLVAHEEVLLGGPGEQLTLRHDSFDRASFMPGVLLGVRQVARRPGLVVGLEHSWSSREAAAAQAGRDARRIAVAAVFVLLFYFAAIGWRGCVLIRDRAGRGHPVRAGAARPAGRRDVGGAPGAALRRGHRDRSPRSSRRAAACRSTTCRDRRAAGSTVPPPTPGSRASSVRSRRRRSRGGRGSGWRAAYDAAGDRRRGREAMRRSIELHGPLVPVRPAPTPPPAENLPQLPPLPPLPPPAPRPSRPEGEQRSGQGT